MRYVLRKLYNRTPRKNCNLGEFESLQEAEDAIRNVNIDHDTANVLVLLDTEIGFIIRLLYFEDGGLRASFRDGSIVKFKKGYCEPAEEKYFYRMTDINENNMRCRIICLNSGNLFPAAETVDIEAVELVTQKL